jgi:hypothetical protein
MTIREVLEKREKAVMEVTNTQKMFQKTLQRGVLTRALLFFIFLCEDSRR